MTSRREHARDDGPAVVGARESFRTRLARLGFNLFPAYWATGARLTFIASDWQEVHLKLPLNWRTRNYVGTIFGGSMFGALDPVYVVMLIKLLGAEYVVWNKAATIRFRRPGRTTLHARFLLQAPTLEGIRRELLRVSFAERLFPVELMDEAGAVHATVEQRIHIARRGASVRDSREGTDMQGGT